MPASSGAKSPAVDDGNFGVQRLLEASARAPGGDVQPLYVAFARAIDVK